MPRGDRNLRTVGSGDHQMPVFYIVIDESGVPYCIDGESGVIVMDAIVTSDPEDLASLPLNTFSDTWYGGNSIPPGLSELKHYSSSPAVVRDFMRKLDFDCDVTKYGTVVWMDDPRRYSERNGNRTYEDAFRTLMSSVAADCLPGVYRICMDGSARIDPDRYMRIAQQAFEGSRGMLAYGDGFLPCDSAVTPIVQAADMLAGEHRYSILRRSPEVEFKEWSRRNREFSVQHGVRLSESSGAGRRKSIIGRFFRSRRCDSSNHFLVFFRFLTEIAVSTPFCSAPLIFLQQVGSVPKPSRNIAKTPTDRRSDRRIGKQLILP